MMKRPSLILVSGAPATGKTTIANLLFMRLRIPIISKDVIKESLFETMGHSDREWSKKLGFSSIVLMFELVEGQLAAGNSVIAETNFYPDMDGPRVEALRANADFTTIEVHCTADPDVVITRYRDRQDAGEQHPGHRLDDAELRKLRQALLDNIYHPMGLDGELLTIDTTDLSQVDLDAVVESVRSVLDRE
jgi:predicted kinase